MQKLNSIELAKMFKNGSNQLFRKYKKIDALNVFPVPDGDTGTNMNLTVTAAVKAIEGKEFSGIGELTAVFSKGALMGARGNSGVILSQIFKGFAIGLEGKIEATPRDIAAAFASASKTAYAAVGTPVEGTILTAVREASDALKKEENKLEDIIQAFLIFVEEGNASVDRTPELLPVLKEAGVVDSGAYGLLEFVYGMLAHLMGRHIEREEMPLESDLAIVNFANDHEGQFGYCTEFVVIMTEEGIFNVSDTDMFAELAKFGDSVAVVTDDEVLKIHVHTERPGDAMNFAQKFGEFHQIKIENMSEQVEENKATKKESRDMAVVAVSNGSGINKYYEDLGITDLIFGGQTMNPSTEDFIETIRKANAKNVIVLPNNKNIMMSAKQAAEILEEVNVIVLPAKTVAQGIAAATLFNVDGVLDDIVEEMTNLINEIWTGEITTAIKDTEFNGVKITKGSFISVVEGEITSSKNDMVEIVKELVDAHIVGKFDLVTLITGKDATSVEEVIKYVESKGLEVEHINGGQAIYPFIFGAE